MAERERGRQNFSCVRLTWLAVRVAVVVINSQLAIFFNLPRMVFVVCLVFAVDMQFTQDGRERGGA